MSVSSDSGACLDRLNVAIDKAEKRLAKIPHSFEQAIKVGEADEGFVELYLCMTIHQGTPTLCQFAFDDLGDGKERSDRPIRELPVHMRIKYAAKIPDLFAACAKNEADWIARVDNITGDIEQTLAFEQMLAES